jgi:hypothetical protein
MRPPTSGTFFPPSRLFSFHSGGLSIDVALKVAALATAVVLVVVSFSAAA